MKTPTPIELNILNQSMYSNTINCYWYLNVIILFRFINWTSVITLDGLISVQGFFKGMNNDPICRLYFLKYHSLDRRIWLELIQYCFQCWYIAVILSNLWFMFLFLSRNNTIHRKKRYIKKYKKLSTSTTSDSCL